MKLRHPERLPSKRVLATDPPFILIPRMFNHSKTFAIYGICFGSAGPRDQSRSVKFSGLVRKPVAGPLTLKI